MNTQELYDDQFRFEQLNNLINNVQCCSRPFPQQSNGGLTRCIACNKQYKIVTKYLCPKCHQDNGPGLTMYNMLKDGRTDWTTCNHCEYDEFPVTEFEIRTEVVFQ